MPTSRLAVRLAGRATTLAIVIVLCDIVSNARANMLEFQSFVIVVASICAIAETGRDVVLYMLRSPDVRRTILRRIRSDRRIERWGSATLLTLAFGARFGDAMSMRLYQPRLGMALSLLLLWQFGYDRATFALALAMVGNELLRVYLWPRRCDYVCTLWARWWESQNASLYWDDKAATYVSSCPDLQTVT